MEPTRYDFSGTVAAVSGGAHGIGRGSAEAYAAAGAHTILLDIDEERSGVVVAAIQAVGGSAESRHCDVTSSESVNQAFAGIDAEHGRLDLLVLSAGGFRNKLWVTETTDEEWRKILALNLDSAFFCTRAAIPLMRRNSWGRIVYIGSGAGLTGHYASPPYSAAKAAVHSLSRVTAVELAGDGITVNALAPGTTHTGRVDALHGEEFMKEIAKAVPVGRIAEVADTVAAVMFLSSPEGQYITGQTLSVDGGRLMV